jgi:hypothetical protein
VRDKEYLKKKHVEIKKISPVKEKYAYDPWGVLHLDYIKITFKKCLCTESIKCLLLWSITEIRCIAIEKN